MAHIAIVDYGLGNLKSVQNGLLRAGRASAYITSAPEDILKADGVILPGVGAFRDGITQLSPLMQCILDAAREGTPMLGICLGMQMLFTQSEEGGVHLGLNLVPGKIVRFERGKVPHMGWNSIEFAKHHPLFDGVADGSFFYFVHSYYGAAPPENEIASCDYYSKFSAVVQNREGNVVGTQFHPEKSGDDGLAVLANFIALCKG
ncbi:MAG: imidazole glycerol phosphate synthase subunit HisH [Methermicoccaceae archaeon]